MSLQDLDVGLKPTPGVTDEEHPDAYLVGVETIGEHAEHTQYERRRRQSVCQVPTVSQGSHDRRKEVDHSANDVAQVQNRHQKPGLRILTRHDESLPG